MGRITRRYPRSLATSLMALVMAGVAVAQQATTVGTLDGHTDPVYAIAWSPDGKTLATAGFDNTVRLWDAATRKEIKKYEGHTKLVLAVAVAPDGKHILSGSQDNTAKIWDYPTSGPVKTFAGHPAGLEALAVKPDGKQFAAAAGKSVKVWDLATGAAVKDLEGHAGEVASASWRGDGGQLATGDKAHSIRLWKGDLTPEAAIETPADCVLALAHLPNNQQLLSAGSDGLARLWQLPVAAPRRFEIKGPVAAFALSRDGTKLATAGADKVVRVWNPADGKLIREITVDQPVVAAAFPQDVAQLAVALANKSVRILQLGRRQGNQENRGFHHANYCNRNSSRRYPVGDRRGGQHDPRRQFRRCQDDQGAQGARRAHSCPGVLSRRMATSSCRPRRTRRPSSGMSTRERPSAISRGTATLCSA